MFDIDRDGKLNKEEIQSMAEGLLQVYKQYDDDDVRFHIKHILSFYLTNTKKEKENII